MPALARTVALAFGLLGGVAASQAPEFVQQYRQRLGGAVDELARVVARFEADAATAGQTRDVALARLRANPDRLASLQGEAMQGHIDRLARLQGQQARLREAGPFARLAVYLAEPDGELTRATFHDFEPALPVTSEGLAAAAGGFLVLWCGALLLARGGRRLVPSQQRLGRA